MKKLTTIKKLTPTIVHWASYAYCIYVWGYASLFKIFQKQSMMESMLSLGFNKLWTLLIGVAELIGLILLLIGLFKRSIKNLGILFLFPLAVGAFTTHMAHQEYQFYWNALLMCVLSVIILWTDKNFRIIL